MFLSALIKIKENNQNQEQNSSTFLMYMTPNQVVIKGRFGKQTLKDYESTLLPFLTRVPHQEVNVGRVKSIYSAIVMHQMCTEQPLCTKEQVKFVGG